MTVISEKKHVSEKITFLGNQFNQEKTKTALAQETFLATAASLVTVTLLPIYLIDSSSRRIMAMYDKDWGYVLRCEQQTHRQSLNFYQYHLCTIQQARGNIEKKLEYILLAQLAYMQR